MPIIKLKEFFKLKFYRMVNRFLKTFLTFSADGEDVILGKLFSNKLDGFYLDIGANSYQFGSNTYYFYLLGWSGICIDPLPNLKKSYSKYRPRDCFLNKAIVNNKTKDFEKKLFLFDDLDNSTTSKNRLNDLKQNFDRTPTKILTIETITTKNLIETYVKKKDIHILNLDIEGGEKEILQDFMNLKVFPWVICVEELGIFSDHLSKQSDIYKLLNKNSYIFFSKTFLSSIYIHKDSIKKFNTPYLNDFNLRI